MEEKIHTVIKETLSSLGAPDVSFTVERPAELSHGDYTVNAALSASKTLGKQPRELAPILTEALATAVGEYFEKIEVAGPGFINLTLKSKYVHTQIQEVSVLGNRWGKGEELSGKRIIVEYSCPNPFKEMHIGHLMSTVIGEAVSRVIENNGATLARDSYGGDVGPHVAKALWALQKEEVTDVASASEVDKAYAKGSRAYEESETAKAEIDALNTALYEGKDTALMTLWRKAREVCLEAFRDIYEMLDTTFDYYFFESDTAEVGIRKVREGLEKGVFTESEGAVIYDGEKKGVHTLVFITSRGTPTYEAKEVGLAYVKEERWPSDEAYILTAAEQIGHFRVVKAALEDIAPALGSKTHHIPHGFLKLTTGKMSSREGNTITARQLLTDILGKAQERNTDPVIAEQVAVGAIKYMIVRQAPGSDIIFDPEKSLSLEGDSGPYLQYALVRARKLLTYDSKGGGNVSPAIPYDVERALIHYPHVAMRAGREKAPQYVTHYLTELASLFNAFYANEQVLGSEEETYKLEVAKAFAVTMENGLSLLGIPAPERM